MTAFISPAKLPLGATYTVDLYSPAPITVALTGSITVDGVASGTNLIWLPNQPTAPEKAIYTGDAAAWVLNELQSNIVVPFTVKVLLGNKYANTILLFNGSTVYNQTTGATDSYANNYTITNLALGTPQEQVVTFDTAFPAPPIFASGNTDDGFINVAVKAGTMTTTGCTLVVTNVSQLATIPTVEVYASFHTDSE